MRRNVFFSLVDPILDRFSAVLGAFFFVQFPMFLQQYLQRLMGHRDEIMRILRSIEETVFAAGKTLPEVIQKFITNTDPDVVAQGKLLERLIERSEVLQEAVVAIQTAPVYLKPWKFLYTLQGEIAGATLEQFQPGIAMTWEGLVYACLGCLVGFLLYRTLVGLVRLLAYPFRFDTLRQEVVTEKQKN